MLIFEQSVPARRALAQWPDVPVEPSVNVPAALLRTKALSLPSCSELDVVRHYTRLSQLNFSIDTAFYPLGSCTMKYNPRGAHRAAMLPAHLARHPLAPLDHSQGYLQSAYELQGILAELTGMEAVSLTPMAGAQGEFAGVLMIQAYHRDRGDHQRDEMLIPLAAHGTNPASAAMCGYKIREIPLTVEGDIDLDALDLALGPRTAGIMLTNPSTLGIFERQIQTVAAKVHKAGGLLYYDGANLNAILGQVRPGDMGFDVMHLNLHKTFATPHGGGGPGAGPVAANAKLAPYLPVPMVGYDNDKYRWLTSADCPKTIGRLSAFMGNAGVILRAYAYARMLGAVGMHRVSLFATLNANYLLSRLIKIGYTPGVPDRIAGHEFVLSLQKLKQTTGITAMDVAKRLLDFKIHAPTVYFPQIVPECLLIEPTETESKATLDHFVEVMDVIWAEAHASPEYLKQAPHHCPIQRVDEVKAARDLDVIWHAQPVVEEVI